MNLILCGLPMSGKSTIGKLLAEKWGWNFTDTDRLIEEAYAKNTGSALTCREIYLTEGEPVFREIETQVIHGLRHLSEHVIAIGGGSLNLPQNVTALQQAGRLIYLKANVSELLKRMSERGLPAYLDGLDQFSQLAEKRIPLYEAAAKDTVDTSALTKQEIVDKMAGLYGK